MGFCLRVNPSNHRRTQSFSEERVPTLPHLVGHERNGRTSTLGLWKGQEMGSTHWDFKYRTRVKQTKDTPYCTFNRHLDLVQFSISFGLPKFVFENYQMFTPYLSLSLLFPYVFFFGKTLTVSVYCLLIVLCGLPFQVTNFSLIESFLEIVSLEIVSRRKVKPNTFDFIHRNKVLLSKGFPVSCLHNYIWITETVH